MLEATKDRVENLPETVRQCCGETMKIRRSSLRDEPCADDVTLKCTNCYRIQTHGIPINRDTYESEMDNRGSRTVDAVDRNPKDNLKALGYIDY
jgi:hypothetical protein